MLRRFGISVVAVYAFWFGLLNLMAGVAPPIPAQEPQPHPAARTAEPSPTVAQQWDSLLQDTIPQAKVDPVLMPPQSQEKHTPLDFLNHFFFESRTDYWRYSTSFTGRPTITGVINTPFTGVFNPNGIPFPPAFQPDANRIYTFLDWGTRGWGSDRVNTHFALRYTQDLSHINIGSAAANVIETFGSDRRFEFLTASVEINGKPTDGMWARTSLQLGRQYVYGAELAAIDGASFTVDRSRFSLTLFGGRRFSFYGDPDQRAIGGANITFRLNRDTSVEYEGLWYVKGSNSVVFRKRLGHDWLLSSYFRAYGGSPVDFSSQGLYSAGNGKTSVRLSFFQKLTNKDYFYDYTSSARDLDPHNALQRLYLGPISPYSQFVMDARRSLVPRFRLGGTIWIRRLNDAQDQGAYNTSFKDYRINSQIFPIRKTETFFEYHQRNSDRLSPLNPVSFDDISHSGETSVKDLTGEIRRSFGEGRVTLSGGAYYRRINLQDRFFFIDGAHQSGWLAGGWWKVDQRTRVYFDYNLDNDFFIFRPSLENSRALRIGLHWKY